MDRSESQRSSSGHSRPAGIGSRHQADVAAFEYYVAFVRATDQRDKLFGRLVGHYMIMLGHYPRGKERLLFAYIDGPPAKYQLIFV